MNTPNILFYAKMEYSTQKGRETPRYTITRQAGYYPPMEQLKGRDGKISFFLLPQSREDISSTPPMKLQGKGSLNFTGLKDYWIEGKISGLAYGYPLDKPTYSSKAKQNPFFDYKDDGYLFYIHTNATQPTKPTYIELLILEGAAKVKGILASYCKMLEMGGFDEALQALRLQATNLE